MSTTPTSGPSAGDHEPDAPSTPTEDVGPAGHIVGDDAVVEDDAAGGADRGDETDGISSPVERGHHDEPGDTSDADGANGANGADASDDDQPPGTWDGSWDGQDDVVLTAAGRPAPGEHPGADRPGEAAQDEAVRDEAAPEGPPSVPVPASADHDLPAVPAGRGGWKRLGAALRPRLSRSQLLAGLLCAALGFALVVQVQQSASDQLSTARQEDLVRLLDEVTDRSEQLAEEVSGLEATRDELASGSGQAQSALELARQRAESEGILSGRLPAEGPGARVLIADPTGLLEASQLFNVLEELRNAGAEVVELNGVRLVTSTWFTDENDTIVVDGQALSSPYEWTVIGDPETMDRALEIPGGALATVRTAGAQATTTRRDHVEITAVREPSEPEYATPQPRDE